MIDQNELRATFNPDGSNLRCHQLRMLTILVEFDKICKKNNIKYWLAYGTLLGAIRHKGFIPWDDDIDVEMTKKDYQKFLEIQQGVLPDNIKLQNHKTDKNYWAVYSKLRDVNSHIIEVNGHDANYKFHGVYIDIFTIEPSRKFFTNVSDILYWNLVFKPSRFKSRTLRVLACSTFYFILNNILFPCFRLLTPQKNDYRAVYGSCILNNRRLKNDFDSVLEGTFENYLFPIPQNYHSYLSNMYGNYMDIPNKEDIHIHTSQVDIF